VYNVLLYCYEITHTSPPTYHMILKQLS